MPKKGKQPAGLKKYWADKKKKSTRKGQLRITSRKAYTGLKKRVRRKVKSYKPTKRRTNVKSSFLSKLKTGTAGKVLIGLGAAQVAGLIAGMIMPQYVGIAKPIAALAAGGVPAVADLAAP